MTRKTATRAGLAVLLAWTATALLAAAGADGTTGAAAPAAAKPPWLVIPNFWPAGTGTEVVGSASGRGWIGFAKTDGGSLSTILGSLRRVGGRLSFAKTVVTASRPRKMIVGSNLVYHSADTGTLDEIRTAPLLANGSVGVPKAVPDNPEKIPPHEYPRDYHPGVLAAVQVGDRFVWVLTGFRITGRTDFMWACCTSAGELSDLSRFIDHKRVMDFVQLGRDTKGRLWLAWRDTYFRKSWGAVRMVELDPDTLAARTPKTFVAPAPDSWVRPELVCADHCRIVMSDLGGDIFTWAPGERSPTRMHLGTRLSPATLLDASFSSGNLVVASERFLQLHRPPWNAVEISVVRGDSRGSHARRVGSAVLAPFAATSPFQWQPPDDATFVPGGLVFFAKYYNFQKETQTRLLAGFLPFAR